MEKKIRKITLSRETLRLLDPTALKNAPVQGGIGSMDRTCQSLCHVCPDTWPAV